MPYDDIWRIRDIRRVQCILRLMGFHIEYWMLISFSICVEFIFTYAKLKFYIVKIE